MFEDPTHIFRRMWAAEAWGKMEVNGKARPACWNRRREDAWWEEMPASVYFDDVISGRVCGTNWYEGNMNELGLQNHQPSFPGKAAPALLGFDESIDAFCQRDAPAQNKGDMHAERCIAANYNILSLYGDRLPYNICRNLEWQVCAAKGQLPGQGSNTIRFARAPRTLDPKGGTGKRLGACSGWVPGRVPYGGVYGYATDDIFYLEVCLFNQICTNGDELFRLNEGQDFVCELSVPRFRQLQRTLLKAPHEAPGTQQCVGRAKGGMITCDDCWGVRDDCSRLPGCSKLLCDFCDA